MEEEVIDTMAWNELSEQSLYVSFNSRDTFAH